MYWRQHVDGRAFGGVACVKCRCETTSHLQYSTAVVCKFQEFHIGEDVVAAASIAQKEYLSKRVVYEHGVTAGLWPKTHMDECFPLIIKTLRAVPS